ncbi:MAG TPA: hypothetical protein VE267_18640 [Bradyrhizobium sp.]|jgi:hypothetical protein|nr:hypothetical protein [Bradyrhizobium sp.]
MQETLLGTWGPQIIAYSQQHPWHVFALLLVAILLMDLMFGKRSSAGGDGGDFGGFDFGGGDGDGCGD